MFKAILMILSVLIGLSGSVYEGRLAPAMAWAGDDDDDDDDGGGGSSSGARDRDNRPAEIRRVIPRQQTPAPRRATPRRAAPAPPPPPPPGRAADEVISRGLSAADLTALEAEGFVRLHETSLRDGDPLHRLRKPPALTLDQARERLRETGADADFNHYYRSETGAPANPCRGSECLAREMIDWPEVQDCGAPPRVGMIDTGLNPDHATLREARLVVHRLDQGAAASGAVHGTAVAALLVGDRGSRSPGLVPHLPLIAVDAFYRDRNDERADAFALVEALDWLAAQEVRIINLSLAGPDNELLAQKVRALEAAGVLMVAAAGNGGPRAAPAYPAAYDEVLAVTAVDRRGQVYRRAGRGEHIDIAAPGVDVWTAASISGARTKTGTSFATPFVTAAAALLVQAEPDLPPAKLRNLLRESARDLGAEGHDAVFGHGLLTPPKVCATP